MKKEQNKEMEQTVKRWWELWGKNREIFAFVQMKNMFSGLLTSTVKHVNQTFTCHQGHMTPDTPDYYYFG